MRDCCAVFWRSWAVLFLAHKEQGSGWCNPCLTCGYSDRGMEAFSFTPRFKGCVIQRKVKAFGVTHLAKGAALPLAGVPWAGCLTSPAPRIAARLTWHLCFDATALMALKRRTLVGSRVSI